MKAKFGKINKDGFLHIQRGAELKAQSCPHGPYPAYSDRTTLCGDWCPLFGEPDPQKIIIHEHADLGMYMESLPDHYSPVTVLSLCSGEIHFEKFEDERGK